MTPFHPILAVAAPNVDQGAAVVGVAVITLVVVTVLGAIVWGSLRLRSVQPILKKGGSGIREERFASEVLRGFLPEVHDDPVGTHGSLLEPTPDPAASSDVEPFLVDKVEGSGAGVPSDFYAKTVTSKPVKAAGPATGTLTSGGPRPELSGAFGDSVRDFVEGIRSLATAVEQAALVGGGSELDRAARSVEAFGSGLGALPIKEVMVSAGKAVEAHRT
jgi:hypothetical protein